MAIQFIQAFQHITRFKSYIVFSLSGLSLGLACVFIISAWTIQELRYDRFHHQPKQIYMVTTDIKDNTGRVSAFPETPQPLAAELAGQIPQVEKAFHFLYLYGGRDIGTEEHSFKESGIAANSDFLEVLNFKLISGNAGELDNLNTILISQDLAKKLFPGKDPINREIIYKEDQLLIVRGVFKNVPDNSSLQFDFLISYKAEYGVSTKWFQLSDATFIKLSSSADPDAVHTLMRQIWREHVPYEEYDIGMIAIADLRYGADFEFFNAEHGSKQRLILFIGVACLILVLACLNYINLISAYALKLTKVITIRKVNGASRKNLMGYFLSESILLAIIAWIFSVILSKTLIHFFQSLLDVQILDKYLTISFLLGFLSLS